MNKEIKKIIEDSCYDDKRSIYSAFFSSGAQTSGKLSNKLALINLICLVSQKMSVEGKTVTPKDVIERITGKVLNANNTFDHYLIGLSVVCDDMMFGVTEIGSLGLTNSNDILLKIKELLAEWLPF